MSVAKLKIRLQHCLAKLINLSVAPLSKAKKSEFGTAQQNSCIADDNVLKERYARSTATAETIRIQNLVQTDKQTNKQKGWA